jgi:hypothetical protein
MNSNADTSTSLGAAAGMASRQLAHARRSKMNRIGILFLSLLAPACAQPSAKLAAQVLDASSASALRDSFETLRASLSADERTRFSDAVFTIIEDSAGFSVWTLEEAEAPSYVVNSGDSSISYGLDGVPPRRVHLEEEVWPLISPTSLAALHGKTATEVVAMDWARAPSADSQR